MDETKYTKICVYRRDLTSRNRFVSFFSCIKMKWIHVEIVLFIVSLSFRALIISLKLLFFYFHFLNRVIKLKTELLRYKEYEININKSIEW